MATKLDFAQRCQQQSTMVAQAIAAGRELEAAYFDRVYNTGGTAIIDADVAALGITAADIAAFITVVQQLGKFVDNQAVATGDYGSTLSKMRTDL